MLAAIVTDPTPFSLFNNTLNLAWSKTVWIEELVPPPEHWEGLLLFHTWKSISNEGFLQNQHSFSSWSSWGSPQCRIEGQLEHPLPERAWAFPSIEIGSPIRQLFFWRHEQYLDCTLRVWKPFSPWCFQKASWWPPVPIQKRCHREYLWLRQAGLTFTLRNN